jgi:hypothetical protein
MDASGMGACRFYVVVMACSCVDQVREECVWIRLECCKMAVVAIGGHCGSGCFCLVLHSLVFGFCWFLHGVPESG